jgi:hypothetical protein
MAKYAVYTFIVNERPLVKVFSNAKHATNFQGNDKVTNQLIRYNYLTQCQIELLDYHVAVDFENRLHTATQTDWRI